MKPSSENPSAKTVKAVSKPAARKTAKPAPKQAAVKKVAASKVASKSPAKPAAKPAARKGPATRKGPSTGKATAAKGYARKSAAKGKPLAKGKAVAKKAPAKLAAPRSNIPKAPEKLAPIVAQLRLSVLTALDEMKAKDVQEIDIRAKASFADLLVIASGTSTRHVKSLADEVVRFVKKAGMMPLGIEGQKDAEWVLVDLGDIVCHIMLPRIREFYALERLWTVGDSPSDFD